MLKKKLRNIRRPGLTSRIVMKELRLYQFPNVPGLEEISDKANKIPAENLFGVLLHIVPLKPILNDADGDKAERLLEYIGRAFEEKMPKEIKNYFDVLEMLLRDYDSVSHVQAAKTMTPQEFLKALLIEDCLTQKSLVPDCFPTESQVSEFLRFKKGRENLRYEQAVALGKKFKVDPLNFLTLK